MLTRSRARSLRACSRSRRARSRSRAHAHAYRLARTHAHAQACARARPHARTKALGHAWLACIRDGLCAAGELKGVLALDGAVRSLLVQEAALAHAHARTLFVARCGSSGVLLHARRSCALVDESGSCHSL
eukprot:336816-Pleurochrysis_carterae.AAC.3